jgi:hypothetical protein
MNRACNVVLMVLLPLSIVCGCSSPDNPPATQPQAAAPPTIQEKYTIGKTTKAEILAEWGEPQSMTVTQSSEVLTYNRSHPTGKEYIPLYHGRDSYRVKLYMFTFNREGLLTAMSSHEQHL